MRATILETYEHPRQPRGLTYKYIPSKHFKYKCKQHNLGMELASLVGLSILCSCNAYYLHPYKHGRTLKLQLILKRIDGERIRGTHKILGTFPKTWLYKELILACKN